MMIKIIFGSWYDQFSDVWLIRYGWSIITDSVIHSRCHDISVPCICMAWILYYFFLPWLNLSLDIKCQSTFILVILNWKLLLKLMYITWQEKSYIPSQHKAKKAQTIFMVKVWNGLYFFNIHDIILYTSSANIISAKCQKLPNQIKPACDGIIGS